MSYDLAILLGIMFFGIVVLIGAIAWKAITTPPDFMGDEDYEE